MAAKVGSVWAVGIDALTFGVSALSLAALRLRREGRAVVASGGSLDGVRFLWRQHELFAVTVVFVVLALLSSGTMAAGILDVLIFHLRNVEGAGERAVGVALGLGAVGAVGGALAAARLRRRFGFAACFVGATVAQGASLALMGSASGVASVALATAVWTGGMTVRGVVTQTLRQEVTPEALLGRVTAAFWTIAAVLAPAGAALVTRAADRWSTVVAFRGAGIGVLGVSLLAAVLLRTQPRHVVQTTSAGPSSR